MGLVHNITVIFTSHSEDGECNASEFCKILGKVNPEVIFEELSLFGFNLFYRENKSDTLETMAVKMYLQNFKVRHIPVDNYNTREALEIKKDMESIFDLFESDINYNRLDKEITVMKARCGFKYLNSDRCSEMFEKMDNMKQHILENSNNEKYVSSYKLWLMILDKREDEIIKNIYNYSETYRFNTALFYIGAGHRKSIIRKIQQRNEMEKLKINWNYNNYRDIL